MFTAASRLALCLALAAGLAAGTPAGAQQPAPTAEAPAVAPAWLQDWQPEPAGQSPRELFDALPRFGAGVFAPAGGEAPAGQIPPGALPWTAPLANAPVPPEYVIGPGDQLAIRVWSRDWEQASATVEVSPEGRFTPPDLEERSAAGLSLEQLRGELLAAYTVIYTEPRVSVTLAEQRVVEVYVTGDATRPGRYRLPGSGTALAALYACGGPSAVGSFRGVQITRPGQPALTLDLYDYLLGGRRDQDPVLQPGNVVFVPPMGPEIGLSGEVNRPARYELAGPTTVAEALRLAGGLKPAAYTGSLYLWRVSEGRKWSLLRVNAADPGSPDLQQPVQSGDLLVVQRIGPTSNNTVQLTGAVKYPGYYPVTAGQRVADLLAEAGGLSAEAHMGAAALLRPNADYHYQILTFDLPSALAGQPEANLELSARDVVRIFGQGEVEPAAEVQVEGAVLHPGKYPWAADLRVSTLVFLAGGAAPGAYLDRAEVLRVTPERNYELLSVDLRAALAGDAAADLALQRGDLLQVKLREQVAELPTVQIAGYVRQPGSFPLREGMKVSDLVFAAGGLLPGAGPAAQVTPGHSEGASAGVPLTLSVAGGSYTVAPDLLLADADSVTITGRGDYQVQADLAHIQGRVKQPGSYALRRGVPGQGTTVWDLLQQAGGLLPDANPGGLVVYRRRDLAGSQSQADDLSRVLQQLNRENQQPTVQVASGQPAQPLTATSVAQGQQAQALTSSVAQGLQTVLSSQGAVSIILPPRAITTEDRVAAIPLDGARLIATQGREANLELDNGDTVVVPRLVNTVTVLGAVPRPGSVPYVAGQRCGEYLNDSGGLGEDAAGDRLVVVHANGKVTPVRRGDVLQPGDVVVVPARHIVRTVHTENSFQQWLRTIVTAVAAVLIF